MSQARAMKPKKVGWTYHITDKKLELRESFGSVPYTEEVSTLDLETGASELGEMARRVLESAVPSSETYNSELTGDVASNVNDLAPSYFLKRAITSGEPRVRELLQQHGYGCSFVNKEDGYRAEPSEVAVHVSLPAGWRGQEES